ncbi:MAG: Gfo/Idh/MocA family oxidoreductase [Chitinophagaceae bacterium]|nr:Gfo/Idh/MocA family oxidoreductase [Chitinophagaceae bacterium]
MQILLIGLGSIGKRHLNNILSLGYTNIAIVSSKKVLPEEFKHLSVFATIQEAVQKQQFSSAIICVPTAQHIYTLEQCLHANIEHIYLEKPVSNNFNDIQTIVTNYPNANIFVGFDMHYDVGLQKVKSLIEEKIIGNIVSVNAQVGQYLPDWRPYEDYSKGMSAKKETGGGVMLDLVHEFDYLYWLFGNANTIAAMYKNSGSLKIETEDIAEVLLHFENGILGTIHLDYLQQKLVRNCLITGSEGSIKWDLVQSKVSWILKDKLEYEFSYTGFERNERFINIMKDFLSQKHNALTTNFSNGLASLKMVLAAKYSSENNVFVKLDEFHPA